MIDSKHLIGICVVCGIIGCLLDNGQCHRPLNANGTQQMPPSSLSSLSPSSSTTSQQSSVQFSKANSMYHQNVKNSFQQSKQSDYQFATDNAQLPTYGRGSNSAGAIALLAAAANSPTATGYQPNRGRKHAFTDLRKNLTQQGRFWERQGDDPERNDHINNPMKILKSKILKSDVSTESELFHLIIISIEHVQSCVWYAVDNQSQWNRYLIYDVVHHL